MSFTVQGNAGVAFASVSDGSNTITADVNGNFTFSSESGSTTFTPSSITQNVTANLAGVNFTAATSNLAWSPQDSRTSPNSTLDVQDSQLYVVVPTDSRVAGPPQDCRAAGAPVDSRANGGPVNSRASQV
jgi:hypothetical protein